MQVCTRITHSYLWRIPSWLPVDWYGIIYCGCWWQNMRIIARETSACFLQLNGHQHDQCKYMFLHVFCQTSKIIAHLRYVWFFYSKFVVVYCCCKRKKSEWDVNGNSQKGKFLKWLVTCQNWCFGQVCSLVGLYVFLYLFHRGHAIVVVASASTPVEIWMEIVKKANLPNNSLLAKIDVLASVFVNRFVCLFNMCFSVDMQ